MFSSLADGSKTPMVHTSAPMMKVFGRPERGTASGTTRSSAASAAAKAGVPMPPPRDEPGVGHRVGKPTTATLLSLEATLAAMDALYVPSAQNSSADIHRSGGGGGASGGGVNSVPHHYKNVGGKWAGHGVTSPGRNSSTTMPRSGGKARTATTTTTMEANDKNGVYVAKDLWRAIRHNLDAKVTENLAMRESHGREVTNFRQQLANANSRAREFEIQFRQTERLLSSDLRERTERAAQLQDELTNKCREMDMMREEYQAQTDALTEMLKNRDHAESKADWLVRSLDDTSFRLKLENHRHELSTGRVKALEKELAYFKERHGNDLARLEEMEVRLRDQAAGAAELKTQVDEYKARVIQAEGEAAAAEDVSAPELDRLRGDNRRLVALLERTAEFKRLVQDTAELKGVHYVALSEVLVDKDVVSEKYPPERDRDVVSKGDAEALHWVPKEALDLTRNFLDRLFPRIPIHPFMMLLLQLNKVWRKHEMACIKDLRRRHKDEMQRQRHREPYREVVMENKIAHLRKQLDTTRSDKQRLEQYRKAAKAAKSAVRGGGAGAGAGADNNKVLLQWGLATIENLSKQLGESLNENKILKRRLAAGGRSANGGAGVAGSGFGEVRVGGGPGYRSVFKEFIGGGDGGGEGGEAGGFSFSSGGEGGEDSGWGDDSENEDDVGGYYEHDSEGFIPPHQEVLTVRDFQDDDLVAEVAAATAQPAGSLSSVSSDAFGGGASTSRTMGGGGGGVKGGVGRSAVVVKHSKTPPRSHAKRLASNSGGTKSPDSGWVTISHADPRPINSRPLN